MYPAPGGDNLGKFIAWMLSRADRLSTFVLRLERRAGHGGGVVFYGRWRAIEAVRRQDGKNSISSNPRQASSATSIRTCITASQYMPFSPAWAAGPYPAWRLA